ncbi:MAG: alpha/beta hydrolase [Verrucomicrobiota bacterium]
MSSAPFLFAAIAAVCLASPLCAKAEEQPVFPLWEKGAPGALGSSFFDIPTLKPYLPDPAKATGAAIVVCPGGGYGWLASHEGAGYAKWFSANGIAAFVLVYRLGSHGYLHPIMLQDAARALRTVRAHAAKWNVDPQRIGIIGSSAGGHLASTLLTHFDAGNPQADDPIDRVSSRPDLGILCYAVITMGPNTHEGTKAKLLGKDPSPALVDLLSNEKQVTKDTPPCFIWHTLEDGTVKVENSIDFARALRAHGVPFDLHIYQEGGHGMGLGNPASPHPWAADCLYWLRVQRFVK